MRWLEVEFQGQMHRVPVAKQHGRLWFHWQGTTYVVDVSGGARSGGKGSQKNSAKLGVILAPMPGKITRVAVALGDPVEKGQVLIVMEAMKMEYTLEADRSGKVSEILAAVGAQVGLGEVLARVGEV